MYTRQKFSYMVFGAVIGITGLAVGLCVSPLMAYRDRFGDIECSDLTVVDENGKAKVRLSSIGGRGCIHVYDENGDSRIGLLVGKGNAVHLNGEDEDSKIGSFLEESVGSHIDGKREPGGVFMSTHEHGGIIFVNGKDRTGWVALSVDAHGGIVGIKSKDGKSRALTP